MKPNIYTYCLKRGYETTSEGTTYTKIKEEITNKFKIKWDPHFELNFRIWFFENFYEQTAYSVLESIGRRSQVGIHKTSGKMSFGQLGDQRVFLKGESCLKYLDYMELIEARRASRQALLFSSISVGLAVIAIIVTIFLGK